MENFRLVFERPRMERMSSSIGFFLCVARGRGGLQNIGHYKGRFTGNWGRAREIGRGVCRRESADAHGRRQLGTGVRHCLPCLQTRFFEAHHNLLIGPKKSCDGIRCLSSENQRFRGLLKILGFQEFANLRLGRVLGQIRVHPLTPQRPRVPVGATAARIPRNPTGNLRYLA